MSRKILLVAVLVLAVGTFAETKTKTLRPLRIYFTANRQGEIAPCGCQVHQIGGLNRIDTYVKKENKRNALFLDAGDTFFSTNPLNPRRREQEKARAKVIAKSYRLMAVDAFSPGERDFAEGVTFLKSLRDLSGATFIGSNLTDPDGNLIFQKFQIVQKDSFRVGIFSLVSPEVFSKVSGVVVTDPEAAAKSVLNDLKQQGVQKIILLSHLGLEQDRKIAATLKGAVDLIIGSHSMDVLEKPEMVGETAIVQPQNEGQQLGVVDLNGANRNITARLVDLDKDLDQAGEISNLMSSYKDEVRDQALEESKKAIPSSADHPYVANPETCRGCHQKQYDWWVKTKHASAYLVLYAKNQHFDPECISCHSLGFQEPGGFSKIAQPFALTGLPRGYRVDAQKPFVEQLMEKIFEKDPGKGPLDSRTQVKRYAVLKKRYHSEIKKLNADEKIEKIFIGVQCEHCHGNRNGHPDPNVPTVKKVSETTCRQCHVPPNAPNFDPKMIRVIGCPLSNART
jgi:hypothetical protein